MNRLTTWRSFGQTKDGNRDNTANLGAFVKREIKTSAPISHSFGRGYGIRNVKPLGLSLLLPANDGQNISLREMSKVKTKHETIEEATLKPPNTTAQPGKESLGDIVKDLVQLTEKEIQTILDQDLSSLQTERGKTWLEQSGYSLRPAQESDYLMLTKKTANTTITVLFKKDYEEPEENEEDEEGEKEEETEEEVIKSESEGQENWVRSGDELPDREDFPTKHSMEVDIRVNDSKGNLKGILHLNGFAGLDDRFYVNEMTCEAAEMKEGKVEDKKSLVTFDDLSDAIQDRIYDYLDELGVDDRMAHYVKTTVAREKKETDISFLNNLKEMLKV